MESFIIEGGHYLSGTITPQGAKNEALEVICASLLTQEEVTIDNIPDILDVNNLIKLLQDFARVVKRAADNYDPSLIAKYAISLAQAFNIKADFEENKRIRILQTILFNGV